MSQVAQGSTGPSEHFVDSRPDDSEYKLEILDEPHHRRDESTPVKRSAPEERSNANEAIESLLLLGRGAVLSPETRQRANSLNLPVSPTSRRYSSGSDAMDCSRSDSGFGSARWNHEEHRGAVSYYQRMRERNNEASKRCRLKRRLRAESLENQCNNLLMSNKLLKQRITRLENIGALLKDGVKKIQTTPCKCPETIALIREQRRKFPDISEMANSTLIRNSRRYRELNYELVPLPPSSEDEVYPDPDPPTPPVLSLPGRSELSVTPVDGTHRTALDVINETIVKTLTTTSSATPPQSPLNLVKLVPATPLSPSLPQQLLLVTSSGLTRKPTDDSEQQFVQVKCEPEIQIVECEGPGVDPTVNCVAAGLPSECGGKELLNLNKLTTYIDLVSRQTATDHNGGAAAERAIIKSRLRVPFWKADESTSFICEHHRYELLHQSNSSTCAMCGKKRAKKISSPLAVMMTITYRMSLEYYTTTGNILPIGHLVCGNCKEKHLKGVDFANSQVVPDSAPLGPAPSSSSVSPTVLQRSMSANVEIKPTWQGAVTIKKSEDSQQSVQRQISSPASLSSGGVTVTRTSAPAPTSPNNQGTENIFTKISRLNDALRSINPRYQPIGFSITSIDSCSPSVLQDAINATETAVSTIMSVIAPGQERMLWETIKPKLDAKFGVRTDD